MNDEQLNRLFRSARAAQTDTTRIEFGFETRLLARLHEPVTPWAAIAWKLMPAFAAVVVALGAWNYVGPADLRTVIEFAGGVE